MWIDLFDFIFFVHNNNNNRHGKRYCCKMCVGRFKMWCSVQRHRSDIFNDRPMWDELPSIDEPWICMNENLMDYLKESEHNSVERWNQKSKHVVFQVENSLWCHVNQCVILIVLRCSFWKLMVDLKKNETTTGNVSITPRCVHALR